MSSNFSDIPSLLVNDVSTDESPVGSSRCSSPQIPAPLYSQHLFKKLLVACCDSCERRASLIVPSLGSGDDEDDCSSKDEESSAPLKKKDNASGEEEEEEDEEDDNTFECPEENKADMHDVSF